MSLSLKAELETWAAALKAYDEQDFEKALDLFSNIADSSKILTNMGLIYATIGEHETAVEHFVAATNLDSYLAIAYFQCGVSNFLLERYDLALVNFEDAYLYLRGNEAINYDQIGLRFKLFSAEILFNKGLAQMNLGYPEEGMTGMQEASRQKVTEEHNVIDEAIRDRGEGYTVFSIPVGVLYRPSENKLKNSKTKDYLGKAKLVAATDADDAFTEFTGVKKRQQALDLDNSEAQNKPEPNRDIAASTFASAPTEPVATRPTIAPDRSKIGLTPGAGVRPDPAMILASRRSQSVSDLANAPPQPVGSDLSRSNSELGRNNSTRLARSATTRSGAVAPLIVKTTQVTGTGGSRANGENGPIVGGMLSPPQNQSNIRRPQGQGMSPAPQRSAAQLPPQSLQPGQFTNSPQSMPPLILPPVPTARQEGHLTQFYESYMDAYTQEPVPLSAFPRPPTTIAQAPSSAMPSLSQMRSPRQPGQSKPMVQAQEPEQPAIWIQPTSSSSSARTSTNTSSSSGLSRASSRSVNVVAGMTDANPNVTVNQHMGKGIGKVKGSNGSVSSGSVHRKTTRRPTARRVTVYDDEGEGGFGMGEFEMASIRVKLHYQDDVRGMTISPTTTFQEFVQRVTAKFGTSLMGLGMKFTDEEGTKISLRDESDFELAIETAREGARGLSDGKIDVWCVDV